jgi:hypothetical protein
MQTQEAAEAEVDYEEDLFSDVAADQDMSGSGSGARGASGEVPAPPAGFGSEAQEYIAALLESKIAEVREESRRREQSLNEQLTVATETIARITGADDPRYCPVSQAQSFFTRGSYLKERQRPQLLNPGQCARNSDLWKKLCSSHHSPGDLPAKAKEYATVGSALTCLEDCVEFFDSDLAEEVRSESRLSDEFVTRVGGTVRKVFSNLRDRYTYIRAIEGGEILDSEVGELNAFVYGPIIFGTHDEGGDLVQFLIEQRQRRKEEVSKQSARADAQESIANAKKAKIEESAKGKTSTTPARARGKRGGQGRNRSKSATRS